MRTAASCLAVVFLLFGVAGGCSAAGSDESVDPPSSVIYEANPLKPGTGFVQLGGQRHDFDEVICASGPVDSDPDGNVRLFGVYANFTDQDSLYAVSLTRYENHVVGAVPTVTDTALVRMQGNDEVLGLKAQRANIIGENVWSDIYDPGADTPLIVAAEQRYEASGMFGSPNGSDDTDALVQGNIAMRCPAGGDAPSDSPTTDLDMAPSGSDDTEVPGAAADRDDRTAEKPEG